MRADLEREYVEYVRAQLPRLHRTAYLLCADAFQADDIVQATLTALYVGWKRAADADNLDGYVHRIMVRRYLDERRRRWSKVLLGDRVPELSAPADHAIEERDALMEALRSLPKGQRSVLVLRFIADLSIEATAEALGCSTGNVKSQCSRGLATLRAALVPRGPDHDPTRSWGSVMNEEQELRNRLEAVDVPSSRIEVDALVREGRRASFRRRSVQAAGGVALAVLMLLAVPTILTRTGTQPAEQGDLGLASAKAATSAGPCQMTELPVPPGMQNARADAVDPTGRYIVGHSTVGQDFQPILWTDGQPQALPMPGTSVELTAVNARGVVVGLVADRSGAEYVFRYENGAYTRLRTPPGNWHPYPGPKINAAGDVLVNVEPSGNSEGKDSMVLLWKAASTIAVKLPLPDGAAAYGITDDGTIVGATYTDGQATAAYIWDQQGNGRQLEIPDGAVAAAYSTRGDWATGGMWASGPSSERLTPTARWNLKTGEVTNLGRYGPGDAVNASGWVVADGSLLRDGAVVELTAPTGQISQATGVSDTGLVVGHAITTTSRENLGPRTWRC